MAPRRANLARSAITGNSELWKFDDLKVVIRDAALSNGVNIRTTVGFIPALPGDVRL